MREELKAVMREVRRNEALIEFMEIKGMLPEPMRSIGDVAKDIVAGMEVQLPLVIEQGKVALSTTFFSMLIRG